MSPTPRPASLLGLAAKYARVRWSSAGPLARTATLVLAGAVAALPVSYGVHALRGRSSGCCVRGAGAATRGAGSCCAAASARMRTALARTVNPIGPMCHALGARERDVPACRSAASHAALAQRLAPFVSPRAGVAVQPSLTYNADRRELGVAYTEVVSEGVCVSFVRLSPSGERVGSPVRLSNPAGESQLDVLPSVAYGANAYVVTWSHVDVNSERIDVRARLLDAEGRPGAAAVALSETRLFNVAPRVVFLPAGGGAAAAFGVAWTGINLDAEGDSLRFVRLNDHGVKQDRERMLRDGVFTLGTAAIAPAADGFVTAWSEYDFARRQSTEVFLRLNRTGAVQGRPVEVAKAQTIDGSAALSFDGRAHALAWERDVTESMALHYSRVGPSSVEQAPVRVDPAPALALEPALASIADGPSLLARTLLNGDTDMAVAVSAVARDGTPAASRRLNPPGTQALMASLARTQDGFVAAWVDTRRGGVELLAQRLTAAGEPVGNPSPIVR